MLPLVLANRDEIQQVILNLVINAQQAMVGRATAARVLSVRTFTSAIDAVVEVARRRARAFRLSSRGGSSSRSSPPSRSGPGPVSDCRCRSGSRSAHRRHAASSCRPIAAPASASRCRAPASRGRFVTCTDVGRVLSDPARWLRPKDPLYNGWFMPVRDVVILSAARTPIGKYGGSFRDLHPAELGAVAARAAIARAGLTAVGHRRSVIGHGRQAGSGPNPARQVGHRAGVPHTRAGADHQQGVRVGTAGDRRPARSRSCSANRTIVLAGGIESMSRMPYLIDAVDARWGHRMGNFTLVDAMYRDGFQCPLSNLIMGETAEMLAQAVRHHPRASRTASRSRASGRRRPRSTPATSRARSRRSPVDASGRTPTIVDRDEHPRGDTTIESLRKLPPVFGEVEGSRHHHGRHLVGHHRRRRRAGACVGGRRAGARPRRRARRFSAGRAPASIRASWASDRCRRSRSCASGPASASTTSISSS